MRILCLVKRVPITGGKMVLTADEQAIETKHLGFTISPHEECGVEEAVRIVEAQGGEVVVLTLGPPEAEEQLRECMALGADRAIHLVSDEEWDAQATASALVEAIRSEEEAVRPDRLRQRVGRRRQLPGRHSGRLRARAAGRHRPEGLDGRRRPRALRAGGRRGARRLRRAAAGRRHGQGGPQPAALSVGAGEAAREPQAGRRAPGRASRRRGSRSCASSSRRASRKQAEVLGRGADAAPAVVEVHAEAGCRMNVLVFVEPRRRAVAAGGDARAVARGGARGRDRRPVRAGRLGRGARRGGRRRRRSSGPAPTAATRCSRTSPPASTCPSRRTSPRCGATR